MKNKFKFKFSPVIIVCFALIYLLAAALLIQNGVRAYSAVKQSISLTVYGYISLAISLILPIVFIALITAVIINSHYSFSDEKLIICFGFLKEKYDLKDITSIIKNVRYNTLTIVLKGESGYKILIDEKSFDDFSSTLMRLNKNALYGETDEEKKKKK